MILNEKNEKINSMRELKNELEKERKLIMEKVE